MSATAAPRPSVLLIDDNPAELRDLAQLLGDDFQLLHASDGRAGFQRAQGLRPDLVLLDVAMPGIDGHAVCRLLKADAATRDIPVIFLTGLHAPEQRLQGFELGAVDYIAKPFHAPEVRARLRVHLNRVRQARAGSEGRPTPSPSAAPVHAAVRYIAEHLKSVPTVSTIAARVGVSEPRLLALFREHLGLTVSGHVSEERLRVGSRLLASTTMSVQEVAFEVGFRSPGNFISAFRERTGLTPKAWRQALQEGRIAAPPPGPG